MIVNVRSFHFAFFLHLHLHLRLLLLLLLNHHHNLHSHFFRFFSRSAFNRYTYQILCVCVQQKTRFVSLPVAQVPNEFVAQVFATYRKRYWFCMRKFFEFRENCSRQWQLLRSKFRRQRTLNAWHTLPRVQYMRRPSSISSIIRTYLVCTVCVVCNVKNELT